MKEIREIKLVTTSEQTVFEQVWDNVQNVVDNFFINTVTDAGAKKYENMLSITPLDSDTIEERRFRILSKWNEQLPYTMRTLESNMRQLCGEDGYTIELKNNEYTLKVRIALTSKKSKADVQDLLERIVPANLEIDLSLLYNQYSSLVPFTYEQLNKRTYKQIREEVLM